MKSNLGYTIHYYARRWVNFVLLHTVYPLLYEKVLAYRVLFGNLSYAKAAVAFLEKEHRESILSSGPFFDENSVVMDVGGETGVWATQIYEKYAPRLKIYEPNPHSVAILRERFKDTNAEIFPFGLGASDQTCLLSNDGMGSSIFAASRNYDAAEKMEVRIRDVREAFEELDLPEVDLIKINIEGGEYDLLPRMIETGLVRRFKIIRVQFHDWIPNAFAMRRRIVKQLAQTHDVEWSYPLVWESWIRRDLAPKSGTSD